ncbi:DMT family transporter [Fusibacter paucivorans]|uniref:DMT family transporter n=1 Tax=Fusibacter paucivorans TaxID=76009 RepID=A0ABS5PMK3_9FIRM|nr:DMT family transporter [Fusibacter paucivorans]MBS7526293.1 DMT family transporter [Fusibacter paucivorans]
MMKNQMKMVSEIETDMKKDDNGEKEKVRAIIYMLISAFFFALMSISVKLAGNDVPIFEKVFFRNFFSIFFAYYIVRKNKVRPLGSLKSLPFLIGRSVCGIGGVVTMFYALERMDVATASTIQKLSQFWVLIFAVFLLKEKIRSSQVIYMIIALAGVIIVSKPSAPEVLIPTLVVFLSSIFAGMAYAFVSKLRTYEEPATVVFFFSFFSTVAMLIPTILDFKWLTLREFIFLLMTGLSAMGGQVFLTSAYHHAKASEVSIYAYANIIFSAVLALFIWGTYPDLLSTVGIIIIVGASYLNYKDVKNASAVEEVKAIS